MRLFYLVAVGKVDQGVLAAVEACVRGTFGCEVRRLPDLAEPGYAYDGERRQYSSTPILRSLAANCPPGAWRLLAVTEKDLFIPMLSFVYGQAQLGGRVAMVSLARLRQEFYGLAENRASLLERAVKEALHEVGHTFGLTHCGDRSCTMCLSTNIRQLDLKTARFCGTCEALLRESMEEMGFRR